jgi:hypothetical protein
MPPAADIVMALHREELTVRAAQARTGFATADFSRVLAKMIFFNLNALVTNGESAENRR